MTAGAWRFRPTSRYQAGRNCFRRLYGKMNFTKSVIAGTLTPTGAFDRGLLYAFCSLGLWVGMSYVRCTSPLAQSSLAVQLIMEKFPEKDP